MAKKILLWILTLSCAMAIFYFSSQEAAESGKASSSVIKTVIKVLDLKDNLSEEEVEKLSIDLTFVVRKTAHFCIYGLLGFLITLLYLEYGFFGKQLFLNSSVTAFLYAISDEFHQSFVKGRSGEIRDVCIDSIGAMCGALIVIICFLVIKRRKERSK